MSGCLDSHAAHAPRAGGGARERAPEEAQDAEAQLSEADGRGSAAFIIVLGRALCARSHQRGRGAGAAGDCGRLGTAAGLRTGAGRS